MSEVKAPSWYAHLPEPVSKPGSLEVASLHDEIERQKGERNFLVVDVRRTDIEESSAFLIPRAINLPAQTFHTTLPALIPILSQYKFVIFHCSSSNGRGPRCAAWYQDELDRQSITSSKSLILKGGIKAWAASYPDEIVRV